LMMFPKETPIVIPAVRRANLLCPDLEGVLSRCGFTRVISASWYSAPLRFGGVEVRALPFYGEQPLVNERWLHEDIRNWGNTYHVRTEHSSCWVIIDSGDDVAGKLSSVAAYIRDELGPPDAVLSNLLPFPVGQGVGNPMYIAGSGQCWLSLNPEQMKRFPSMSDCTTVGVEGAAELCRISRSRYMVPYAHWWHPLGTPVREDRSLTRQLAQELTNSPTQILSWCVGDRYDFGPRGPSLTPLEMG
jgi:hypothetical protein